MGQMKTKRGFGKCWYGNNPRKSVVNQPQDFGLHPFGGCCHQSGAQRPEPMQMAPLWVWKLEVRSRCGWVKTQVSAGLHSPGGSRENVALCSSGSRVCFHLGLGLFLRIQAGSGAGCWRERGRWMSRRLCAPQWGGLCVHGLVGPRKKSMEEQSTGQGWHQAGPRA